jgi:hypothetical protein
MTTKTVSERVQALRQRRESGGMVRVEVWIYPIDAEKLRKEVAGLNAYRERMIKKLGRDVALTPPK